MSTGRPSGLATLPSGPWMHERYPHGGFATQTCSAATFPNAEGLCLFPRQGDSCQDLTTPHVTLRIKNTGMTGLREQELPLRF